MPFARRQRRYFKYGTEPDATIVGSFGRIDKGIASSSNANNYLKLPEIFDSSSDNWEIVLKSYVRLSASAVQSIIFGGNSSAPYNTGFTFSVKTDNYLYLWLTSNGSTWNIANGDTNSAYKVKLTEEGDYIFKLSFTGSSYILAMSINGSEFKDYITVNSSTKVYQATVPNGVGANCIAFYPSESYININGERWWSGKYTKVGSWIDNGVVSGFSGSNYLMLPEVFNPTSNTWEMGWCFTTGDDVSTEQVILGNISGYNGFGGMNLRIHSGSTKLCLSNSSSDWVIARVYGSTALSPNTKYWMKVIFTGSLYELYLSTDGADYHLDSSASSTSTIVGYTQVIGSAYHGADANYSTLRFRGSIDLSQSYIKINNQMWWHGTRVYELSVTGEDVWEKWYQPVLSSAGVVGGSKFAISSSSQYDSDHANWYAFDGNDGSEWESSNSVSPPHWIAWYNPNKLKVSRLDLINGNNSYITRAVLQGSNNYYKWDDIQEIINDVGTGGKWSVDISGDTGYLYHRLYITNVSNNSYVDIAKIGITANELTKIAGAIEEADYSVDENKLYQAVKANKSYYKNGGGLNANVVGTFASIEKGVASGFTSNSYLKLPKDFDVTDGSSWEMVWKITTPSEISSAVAILGRDASSQYASRLLLGSDRSMGLYIANGTSSWTVSIATPVNVIEFNTEYVIKASYENGVYSLFYKLAKDEDWILVGTQSAAVCTQTNFIRIGHTYDSGSSKHFAFTGSIDLSKSYIKINNELWWSGDEYIKVGKWIDGGVVSGFTASEYLTISTPNLRDAYAWEIYLKANANAYDKYIFQSSVNSSDSGRFGVSIYLSSNKTYKFDLSFNGSSWVSSSSLVDYNIPIELNKDYYIKMSFNGSIYKLEISEDNITWQTAVEYSSTEKLAALSYTRIGSYNNTSYYWNGSIDLDSTYININGERWWSGLGSLNIGTYTSTSGWTNASNAFDYSSDTFASCGTSTDYIEYDFGKKVVVKGVYARGNYVSSVSRSMGLRFYGVVDDKEIYLGETNKPSDVATNEMSAKFVSPEISKMRIRLAEKNISGDAPTTSYPSRVRDIIIEGYVVGDENDYDFSIKKITPLFPVLRRGKNFVTLFESAVGGDYSFELTDDSKVRISLVGGGGAAAMRGVYDDRGYGWSGGSGGAFVGTYELKAGTYNVTVGSANNNTKGQGGNTNTMNPDDTTTHDSYITGLVRVGGGGSGTTSGVGAAGASATFEVEPTSITLNSTGKSGASGSGGKGSGANWTHNGAESVYKGYGKGQGCSTSEYASRRYWISGTDGYAKIEIWSEAEIRSY